MKVVSDYAHESSVPLWRREQVYFFLPARLTAFFAPVFLAAPAFFLVEPFGLPRPLPLLALGAAAAAAAFFGDAPFLAAIVFSQLLKLRLSNLV